MRLTIPRPSKIVDIHCWGTRRRGVKRKPFVRRLMQLLRFEPSSRKCSLKNMAIIPVTNISPSGCISLRDHCSVNAQTTYTDITRKIWAQVGFLPVLPFTISNFTLTMRGEDSSGKSIPSIDVVDVCLSWRLSAFFSSLVSERILLLTWKPQVAVNWIFEERMVQATIPCL